MDGTSCCSRIPRKKKQKKIHAGVVCVSSELFGPRGTSVPFLSITCVYIHKSSRLNRTSAGKNKTYLDFFFYSRHGGEQNQIGGASAPRLVKYLLAITDVLLCCLRSNKLINLLYIWTGSSFPSLFHRPPPPTIFPDQCHPLCPHFDSSTQKKKLPPRLIHSVSVFRSYLVPYWHY
jgi:hypothetical protein